MNSVSLNRQTLEIMALGQESERVLCPVCGGAKETGKLVCPKCFSPETLKMIRSEIGRIKAAAAKKSVKQESEAVTRKTSAKDNVHGSSPSKTEMIDRAVNMLAQGVKPEVVNVALAKIFRSVHDAKLKNLVVDAQAALAAVPKIEAYARENGVGFEDVDSLAEGFISKCAQGELSSFVVKAAIYCVIRPKLERQRSFEAKVAEVTVELNAMSMDDALNTRIEDARDSLVEAATDKGRKVDEKYRRFCWAAAAEAIKRFRNSHPQEVKARKERLNAEVQKALRIDRSSLANRFSRRGWSAKVVNG